MLELEGRVVDLAAYIICPKAGIFQEGWIRWLNSVIKDPGAFHFSALPFLVWWFILRLALFLITRWLKRRRGLFTFCLDVCLFDQWGKALLRSPHQLILMSQWSKLHDMPDPKPFTGKGNAATMSGSHSRRGETHFFWSTWPGRGEWNKTGLLIESRGKGTNGCRVGNQQRLLQ